MKVAVVCGGISTEREISIRTGVMVCSALRSKGHNAILIDVFFGNENLNLFDEGEKDDYDPEAEADKIRANDNRIEERKKERPLFLGKNLIKICRMADIAFLALHGENGENGKVQASFDLLGIKYTGSGYLGSALAMDKGLTKNLLKYAGLPTPKGYVLNKATCGYVFKGENFTFPVVVKPSCGGSSVGVYIANDEKEYKESLLKAFEYEDEVVVEEFIKGREFSIGIVGDEALPIIEIIPKDGFYDYENKYLPGRTLEVCPAELEDDITKSMQKSALQVASVLRLKNYCRIDYILAEDGKFYCLEANTLPGMTATSLIPQEAAAVGIDFPTLCEKLIEISLENINK